MNFSKVKVSAIASSKYFWFWYHLYINCIPLPSPFIFLPKSLFNKLWQKLASLLNEGLLDGLLNTYIHLLQMWIMKTIYWANTWTLIDVILTLAGGWRYLSIFHQVFSSLEAVVELWDPPRCDDLNGTKMRLHHFNRCCVKTYQPWLSDGEEANVP